MSYPNFLNAITFEMTLAKKIYWRRVYATLDLIADIGGLVSSIRPICIGVLSAFNFYSSY